MDHTSCAVQVLERIEHLIKEKTTSIFAETLTFRVFDQVEHVKIVASQVLSDQVDVRVVTVGDPFDVHDSIIAVAQHTENIAVVEFLVIFDFFFNLRLVGSFDVSTGSQDFQDNLLAT